MHSSHNTQLYMTLITIT